MQGCVRLGHAKRDDVSAEHQEILKSDWWAQAYDMLKSICRHTGPDLGLHASVDAWFSIEDLCLKVTSLGEMTPELLVAADAIDDSNALEVHGFEARFKDAHGHLGGPHGFAKNVRACRGHLFRSVDTAVSLVGDLSPELYCVHHKMQARPW